MLLVVALLFLWSIRCLAQSAPSLSDTELSEEVDNPVAEEITLPLRYEADFRDGPTQATESIFSLNQALVPFRLNDDWALITRTKLPGEVQPPKNLGGPWADGLANGYTTFFLSPARGSGFFWGVGPVLYYPTAMSSALGVYKWGSGPSIAFFMKDQGPWDFGAVTNNIWTFAGPPGSNQLLLNPIVNYNLGDGWSVGSSPNITTNWNDSGGKWTVPVGGGFGKAVRLEGQAIKFSLAAYYNAIRPQASSKPWLLQATLTFVFPK
jgi:hypothetical protein